MPAPFPDRDPALQQQPADLVDHRCATPHPTLPHPVQGLHLQLSVALDRHKSHFRSPHCLRNRVRIDVVVLVCLHVRLDVLRRHQTHFMTLLAQRPAKKMSPAAGFHANQPYMQIRGEVQQLLARTFLPHHRLANRVDAYQVKYRLPKINANRVNLHRTASHLSTSLYSKPLRRRTMLLHSWDRVELIGMVRRLEPFGTIRGEHRRRSWKSTQSASIYQRRSFTLLD